MTSYEHLAEAIEERAEKRAEKRAEERAEKEKIEVIRKARLKGATIEFIADIVGLSSEKVRNILDELGIE